MELEDQLNTTQELGEEKKRGLNATQLKMIALTAMLLDHIGAIIIPFLQGYNLDMSTFVMLEGIMVVLRLIGRLAFPIFAFLVVNGFYYTSSRKDYLLRLSLFALISEPFFDKAVSGTWIEFSYQNIFFTLVLGLLAIWGYDNISKEKGFNFIGGVYIILVGLIAVNLRTDYSFYGVLTIFMMYLFFKNRKHMSIAIGALNILLYAGAIGIWPYIPALIHDSYGYLLDNKLGMILQVLLYLEYNAQLFCLIALWPLSLYNNEKGSNKINKYYFYAFYPVHLFVLSLIIMFLMHIG
ncbi:MAG: conjugal transfer protein TraX [Turicibacter sp.]|nr:conjugal transfer protein TraX [Turicibacter sp.]